MPQDGFPLMEEPPRQLVLGFFVGFLPLESGRRAARFNLQIASLHRDGTITRWSARGWQRGPLGRARARRNVRAACAETRVACEGGPRIITSPNAAAIRVVRASSWRPSNGQLQIQIFKSQLEAHRNGLNKSRTPQGINDPLAEPPNNSDLNKVKEF